MGRPHKYNFDGIPTGVPLRLPFQDKAGLVAIRSALSQWAKRRGKKAVTHIRELEYLEITIYDGSRDTDL